MFFGIVSGKVSYKMFLESAKKYFAKKIILHVYVTVFKLPHEIGKVYQPI